MGNRIEQRLIREWELDFRIPARDVLPVRSGRLREAVVDIKTAPPAFQLSTPSNAILGSRLLCAALLACSTSLKPRYTKSRIVRQGWEEQKV